ncbi:hypothetical protein BDN70DRAFT_909125 [Pholiota conissans]|uniref:CxC5 like cysteine cluster associated with KDZ domain-containing protein n=1 Tax=Pholiota conissans TaxID=109636 RepID=A0A9P6CMP7_9AGAR|nr:hypothetical protein BDN70DRAFT_909125 [Pholiota conissans]
MVNGGVTMTCIHQLLSMQAGLSNILKMEDTMHFVRLSASLKQHIIHIQKPSYNETILPDALPVEINEFLGNALNLDPECINGSMCALYPPITQCNNPLCTSEDRLLKATATAGRRIILFTLEDSACATHYFKLQCATCETTYHNNYSVYKHEQTYYPTPHQFISRDVVQLFLNLMLLLWTFASNSVAIYNKSLVKPEYQPSDWGFSFELHSKHIWSGVSHLAILEYYEQEAQIFVVPHGEDQKDCLIKSITVCNKLFKEKGQLEWSHYCEKCICFFKDENGRPEYMVRAVISNGITIRHLCCNVAHCTEDLEHKYKQFCPGHEYLLDLCSIEDCFNPIISGTMVCSNPNHQALWHKYQSRNAPDKGLETIELTCPQKSAARNRQLRACFGQRQMHSIQIKAYSCGIVAAQNQFFGSETVLQTVAMLKQVFCEPGSMPQFFIYNNCCSVYNYLQGCNDPLFNTLGCPVDLGGYHAIFREMTAYQFNFLLDKLIMRKN